MTRDLKPGLIDGADDVPAAQSGTFEGAAGFGPITRGFFMREYVGLDCRGSERSKGHRALRGVRFRNALNWAAGRQKRVDVARGSLREKEKRLLGEGG